MNPADFCHHAEPVGDGPVCEDCGKAVFGVVLAVIAGGLVELDCERIFEDGTCISGRFAA